MGFLEYLGSHMGIVDIALCDMEERVHLLGPHDSLGQGEQVSQEDIELLASLLGHLTAMRCGGTYQGGQSTCLVCERTRKCLPGNDDSVWPSSQTRVYSSKSSL